MPKSCDRVGGKLNNKTMEKNKKFEIINEGRLNAIKGGGWGDEEEFHNPNCPKCEIKDLPFIPYMPSACDGAGGTC